MSAQHATKPLQHSIKGYQLQKGMEDIHDKMLPNSDRDVTFQDIHRKPQGPTAPEDQDGGEDGCPKTWQP